MKPNSFSDEFKAEAVRAVIESSRVVSAVAKEYKIGTETLRSWVVKYRREHAGDEPVVSEAERVELERLRKEVRELRMEREFLGKAAAFFAKEYR
jgi:transposase